MILFEGDTRIKRKRQTRRPLTFTLMEGHRVHGAPVPGVFLLEDWCTPAEEEYVTGRVYKEGGRWTQLSGRRLQNWGGVVHEKGKPEP